MEIICHGLYQLDGTDTASLGPLDLAEGDARLHQHPACSDRAPSEGQSLARPKSTVGQNADQERITRALLRNQRGTHALDRLRGNRPEQLGAGPTEASARTSRIKAKHCHSTAR